MKRIINLIALIIVAAGFVILIDPFIRQYERERHSEQAVEEFKQLMQDDKQEGDPAGSVPEKSEAESVSSDPDNGSQPFPEEDAEDSSDEADDISPSGNYSSLYRTLRKYNRELYKSKQSELRDAFSYTTSSIRFTDFGLPSDVAGYITIERMGIELPMYVGSSIYNMSYGATIMDHTSMPIGGQNTNCVIAAHRMAGYFGDIELLSRGDIVRITNLWGELRYRVVKIIVIDPYDTDKIKIIPGHDMITLLTCHPYWSSQTRYIVYCERDTSAAAADDNTVSDAVAEASPGVQEPSEVNDASPASKPSDISSPMESSIYPDGKEYTLSQTTINTERIVRIAASFLAVILMIICIINIFRRKPVRKE